MEDEENEENEEIDNYYYKICLNKKKYKYNRKYIIDKILSSPKTKNGIYYCPNILDILMEEDNENGYYDIEYYLCRCYFKNKIFYTYEDILILKQEEYDINVNYNNFIYYNKKFYNDHIDIINKNLKLNDYIDKYKNKIEDLIDMFVIIYNYKDKIIKYCCCC